VWSLFITFHVSVMAITPAIASHKVRHPSPSNFSVLLAPRQKVSCRDLAGAGGLRWCEATEPSAKRRPLSAVPDTQREGNIKKLPLISHKVAANWTDAL
jgi:hypothetical protein